MYSGQCRILSQGAVSEAVQVTCGLPPGCGLAVDLLHAFLVRTLRSAGRQVEVRKSTPPKLRLFVITRELSKSSGLSGGRLPPVRLTTRDLSVDTQWASWRNPVQKKRISTFHQSMNRVRALDLLAHVVGLYGADVGCITAQGMSDHRICARHAPGKGASLRRSATFGAHGARWHHCRLSSLCRLEHC
eukprot:6422355-Amphidinium_carterae.1